MFFRMLSYVVAAELLQFPTAQELLTCLARLSVAIWFNREEETAFFSYTITRDSFGAMAMATSMSRATSLLLPVPGGSLFTTTFVKGT